MFCVNFSELNEFNYKTVFDITEAQSQTYVVSRQTESDKTMYTVCNRANDEKQMDEEFPPFFLLSQAVY